MIRLVLAIIAGLGCLYCVRDLLQDPPSVSPPQFLTATPLVQDLGKVGEQDNHVSYIVENSSEEQVSIASVEKHCSCTDVSISTKGLKPGARTNVDVTWNTHGMVGPSRMSFNIYYSVGSSPGLRVLSPEIVADVIPDVSFIPAEVSFTCGAAAIESQYCVVEFVPKSGDTQLLVQNIICNCPAVTVVERGSNLIRIQFEPSKLLGSQRNFTMRVVFDKSRLVAVPIRVTAS